MWTLYGMAISPGTRKTRWALEETGVAYSLVETDLRKGETRTPEFLRLNPNGTIPTLLHEDFPVWETNAIVLYVAETLAGATLLPQSRQERAAVHQWLSWEATSLHEPLHRAWLVKFRASLGMPDDPTAWELAAEAAKKPLGVLDRHLAERNFVACDRFGVADICLGAAVAQTAQAAIDLSPYPHLQAWLDRLVARPAFARSHPLKDAS